MALVFGYPKIKCIGIVHRRLANVSLSDVGPKPMAVSNTGSRITRIPKGALGRRKTGFTVPVEGMVGEINWGFEQR